jgi:hypothetical protein
MNLLFILLFAFNIHAWSPAFTQKWSKTNSLYANKVSGAEFATFWGGLRRAIYWSHHKGRVVDLKPRNFKTDIPVYLSFSNKKKDLVLFYPGVFGLADGEVTPVIIDVIEKKNLHLAVIPNITSAQYQKAIQKNNLDPILQEGSNQQNIFEKIIESVGRENIAKIHVIGESLGSFQVMTAATENSFKSHEISSITLMWPPLNLDLAIKRFDQLISKSLSNLDRCSFWWKWPSIVWETKFNKIPDLSYENKSCLGSLIIGEVFVRAIKKNAQEILKRDHSIPSNFSEFTSVIMPETDQLILKKDERLSLLYQLKNNPFLHSKFFFISSKDDFLNVKSDWELMLQSFPHLEKNTFLFDWGGHSGPVGLEGLFESIINERLNGN